MGTYTRPPSQVARDDAEREKRQALARQQQEEDFRWLMSTETGRRIAFELYRHTDVDVDRDCANAVLAYRRLGTRDVWAHWLKMHITRDSASFVTMLKENDNG